jgi:GT2 family glycosyltransferase
MSEQNKNEIDLSINIVNYNSKSVLTDCLRSVIDSQFVFKFEVIVIDNASSERIDDLRDKFCAVKFIFNKKNVGYAAANNVGIKNSVGRNILLLNPDTIVNKNSFQPMISYLDENSDAGLVGCKIFNKHGEIEHSTHSFPNLIKEFIHANELIKLLIGYDSKFVTYLKKIFRGKSLESYWEHNTIKEVDHVTGACMMVKRKAIDQVGLLDEAFFIYNEEVEWSFRMKKAGYKSIFLPDSNIIHLFGYSTKQNVQRQQVNYLLLERYRGMFYLFQKHYGFLKPLLLRLIILQGFTLRLLASFLKLFITGKKEIKNEILYIKKIMALGFARNFDWRN